MSALSRNTSLKRVREQLRQESEETAPPPASPLSGPPLHAPTPLRPGSFGASSGVAPHQSAFPGSFTPMEEGSPLQSPFTSQPPSRRESFAYPTTGLPMATSRRSSFVHPNASGPRPPPLRRKDSLSYPDDAIDVSNTPSMLSRAGSPTLPLMSEKTRSQQSSRRGSFAGPGGPLGGGLGGFGMSDLMSGRGQKDGEFVGSVDCGTTSTRFIVFDKHAKIICEHQLEFQQHYPHPGWHEHEPYDLVDSMNECIEKAVEKLEFLGFSASQIKGIGITNQRETVVCWDKQTGEPLCRTVVWDDARTVGVVREFQKKLDEEGLPIGDAEEDLREKELAKKTTVDSLKDTASGLVGKMMNGLSVNGNGHAATLQHGEDKANELPEATIATSVAISGEKRRRYGKEALVDITGIPLSTYFSAIKLKWLITHHPEVKKAFEEDRLAFGTVDSWLLYNLTGGKEGGIHAIDCTNASRTLLMSLKTMEWYQPLIDFFGLKASILPKIVSSSERYGKIAAGPLSGVPIAGMVGDQQAALVGNKCLQKGTAKNTYGTGSFVLFNTGPDVVRSQNGLISTVGYRLGSEAPPTYALEGSIAVAGSAIKWLRDQVGLIEESSEMDALCGAVKDTGGVYFVTAFSGLLAPYWDPNATGMIVGLTQYSTSAHIARATLEAVCYQTRAVLDVIEKESGVKLDELKVDGGVTNSDLAMQIQADIGGFRICRPHMRESTALGSALLAGHALNLFGWDLNKPETLNEVNMEEAMFFEPEITEKKRQSLMKGWEKAVSRAKAWHTVEEEDEAEAEFEKEEKYL